jgi:hypothetical protein
MIATKPIRRCKSPNSHDLRSAHHTSHHSEFLWQFTASPFFLVIKKPGFRFFPWKSINPSIDSHRMSTYWPNFHPTGLSLVPWSCWNHSYTGFPSWSERLSGQGVWESPCMSCSPVWSPSRTARERKSSCRRWKRWKHDLACGMWRTLQSTIWTCMDLSKMGYGKLCNVNGGKC